MRVVVTVRMRIMCLPIMCVRQRGTWSPVCLPASVLLALRLVECMCVWPGVVVRVSVTAKDLV